MFAKRARSRYFPRDLGLGRSAATVRACNDNQPLRLAASSRRSPRSGLSCRWRQTPAGRLECRWHAGNTAPDEGEAGISRPVQPDAISRPIALFAA